MTILDLLFGPETDDYGHEPETGLLVVCVGLVLEASK